MLARLISPAFLTVVAGLLALLIAIGVLIWLAERRTNAQFRQKPLFGIGAGLWWSAVTMTTVGYGDKAPTTGLGRVIALVWMFAGLIVISTFTVAITTNLTVNKLDASIYGVDQPSLNVRMKATMASSSASVSPRSPNSSLLTLTSTSGAGQQLSPGFGVSNSEQVGLMSRVL